MEVKAIDFGAEIGKSWDLYKGKMGLFIVANLLATLIGFLTCGILTAPLLAGVYMINRRVLKEDPNQPTPGDVFKGFDLFAQSLILTILVFLVVLILGLIPVIGQIIAIFCGAVLSWGMAFVVYENLSAVDALKKLWQLISSGKFTMPLLFGVVAGLIGGAGSLLCGVGAFFTLPLSSIMVTCAYHTIFEDTPMPVGATAVEPVEIKSEDLTDIKPPHLD